MEVRQEVLSVYKPLFLKEKGIRYIILMGGRGGGRSTVASQFAVSNLIGKKYFRGAIMRFIYGDIKNSIYKEIMDRIEEQKINDIVGITDKEFTYGKNSLTAVGFRKSSSDQTSKLKSLANYNTVIIEEADEVDEADFMQLDDSLRTVKGDITIILLLNPPSANHWIIKRWFNLEKTDIEDYYKPILKDEWGHNTLLIESNYKTNKKNLSRATIENYERYKKDKPNYYNNTILGLVPKLSNGIIFDWEEIQGVPKEAILETRGLDFGFSNDPTALTGVYKWNGAYIVDEEVYEKGLSNSQIAKKIKLQKYQTTVIADSAEPKSIEEIKMYGIDIDPTIKGKGSINVGIQWLQGQKIYYTKRSIHIKKEVSKYSWKKDRKNGIFANKPEDMWNHAMDSIRYALSYKIFNNNDGEEDLYEDIDLMENSVGNL